jgi:hypothetical protein
MAEEKKEKDEIYDTCNQTSSCDQEAKETYSQDELRSARSRLEHRPGYCTIPEWMERWALGE